MENHNGFVPFKELKVHLERKQHDMVNASGTHRVAVPRFPFQERLVAQLQVMGSHLLLAVGAYRVSLSCKELSCPKSHPSWSSHIQ